MAEEILFKQGNVIVSKTALVIAGKTYEISSIQSVKLEVRSHNLWWFVCALIGFMGLLIGKYQIILGLLPLELAFYLFFLRTTQYAMILNAGSKKQRVLVSKDKAFVESVIKAVFDALSYDVISCGS